MPQHINCDCITKLTLLIVGDDAVLRAGEDSRGYLVLRGRNPTVGHHSGCLQRPSEADNGRLHSVRSGDAGAGHPADIRPIPAAQETGEPDAGDLPGPALVTELHLAAASTIDEDGLALKEFLLEASRGVPTFPGERSGPELPQFRWSWSYSASDPLYTWVIAFRRQARLTWQGRQPQPAAWVSSCRAISISKKALSLPAA